MIRVERLEDRLAPAAGGVDPAFGTNGVASIGLLTNITDVLLQDDGKILAVGSVGSSETGPPRMADFGIVRLNRNGTPDTSFGSDGTGLVRVGFDRLPGGIGNDVALRVVRDPRVGAYGGGYIIAGTADVPLDGFTDGVGSAIAVLGLNSDGRIDDYVVAKSTLTFIAGESSSNPTVAVRSDRQIIVAGDSFQASGLRTAAAVAVKEIIPKYQIYGSWSPAFTAPNIGDATREITLTPDAGFLVTTTESKANPAGSPLGTFHRTITQQRFRPGDAKPTSVPDPSYAGGTGTLTIGEFDGTPNRFNAILPDATVVVGDDGWPLVGFTTRDSIGGYYNGTQAYSYLGLTDADFGTSGKSTTVPFARTDAFDRLADGREYVITTGANSKFGDTGIGRLARRLRGGAPDPSYGNAGSVDVMAFGFTATEVDAAADGSAVVWGGGSSPPRILRLLGDAAPPAAIAALPRTAVAAGLGDGAARVLDARGRTLQTYTLPFENGPSYSRVAAGDFTGDGIDDIVFGTGPGVVATVELLNRGSGTFANIVKPFEDFTGGVYLAAGDLDGDGRPELIVTPDQGGGPRVDIYRFVGDSLVRFDSFFGIDDANFRGGARAAVGDVNRDGRNDLIVAAGFGGGPRVAGFDGRGIGTPARPRVFNDYFAFEETLRNGVFVAAGDLDGDGFAEVIAGGGPGGGPRVTAFRGDRLLSNQYSFAANFFAGDDTARDGVRLAVANFDNDARADIVASSGTTVRSYRGAEVPQVDFTLQNTGIYVG
jgi:hypothetical protein